MTSPEPAGPVGAADRQDTGRGRLPWVAATAVLAICGMALRQRIGLGRRLPWVAATVVLAMCGTVLIGEAFNGAGPPRPSAAAAVPLGPSDAAPPLLSMPLDWPRQPSPPTPPSHSMPLDWLRNLPLSAFPLPSTPLDWPRKLPSPASPPHSMPPDWPRKPSPPLLSMPLDWPREVASPAPQPVTTPPPAPSLPPAAPPPPAAAQPMRASTPTRIRIPSLDISAPIVKVGLDEHGGIAVPDKTDRNLAGWYQDGVTPGQSGTASIVGHVDTAKGPAVFFTLGALARGARIEVERADGTVAIFEVDGVEEFAKDAFPTKRVFADATRPELRVVTCGGTFSKKRHYSGNVVAFSHLVS
jgi:sortase (surface protein transpeptidase)